MSANLIERLRKERDERDAMARLVSNIGKPRSDNNEGRLAQLLDDAITALEEAWAGDNSTATGKPEGE